MLLLKLIEEMPRDPPIEIYTTKMRIASCGNNLKDTVIESQNGNVQGAAAQIIYDDILLRFLVESICDRCGSRVIDNPQHGQTSDGAGIFCRLPLRIAEMRGHSQNSLAYLPPQVVFSCILQASDDHCQHFFWRHHFVVATHVHTNCWLAMVFDDIEWQRRDLFLHHSVRKSSTRKPFQTKYRLRWLSRSVTLA